MNFGYNKPKEVQKRSRPPQMVLVNEDEATRSPNTSLLIEKKMQGTPDTTKIADDMVGGNNWEFQMDPFDTWSHEKENNRGAPHRRVDPEMPKRSFLDKALCRKPKMERARPTTRNHPSGSPSNDSERFSCLKPNPNRSKSVPRSHRQRASYKTPKKLFHDLETPQKPKGPSKYSQQVDEFIEVSATPKQLKRVTDLSDIEQREKLKREQEKSKPVSPIIIPMPSTPANNTAYSTPTKNGYSPALSAPTLDDGNSVLLDGTKESASIQHEILSLSPEDTQSVFREKNQSILQCVPLCNAGEMLFMAVDPQGSPKKLTNHEGGSPSKSKTQRLERIHHSMPVSSSVYMDQSLASSFQDTAAESEIKKTRVQSYTPTKNRNRYNREAFEEEVRLYQKNLLESRRKSKKMEDIQERRDYGESAATGNYNSQRAMHHSNRQSVPSNPHRRSRSVGRSEASSASSSSSSSSRSPEYIPGRSARKSRNERPKSALHYTPPKRDDRAKHSPKEVQAPGIPRKRSDFMISGMEMVAGDIERHRSNPKKEHHHRSEQARPKAEPRGPSRMKPGWRLTPAELLKTEKRNDVFHSDSGPVPICDVISIPQSPSNKLPIKTVEIPMMVDSSFEASELEHRRVLEEDDTDLDSGAFDRYDSDSIYKDLKKTEKRRRSLRSTKSYDAYSRKSGATRQTDFTYGSASVEYDGCFELL